MPASISAVAVREKNKLASGSIWLLCLEIRIPALADPIRLVASDRPEDSPTVTWRGVEWTPFPFQLNEVVEQTRGEVPRVDLLVSNVSRAMESHLQEWDAWNKANGYEPVTMSICLVNSLNLAGDTPEIEYTFQLKAPSTDSRWARFTLSADNPFNRRFPQNRILKNTCPYRFKGSRCQYSGLALACGHTLANCRTLENRTSRGELRYGGCIGAGQSGLQTV